MIEETIARIESRLRSSENLTDERRRELLELLARLKEEVDTLSETHSEDAHSIAGYTETSIREATRDEVNPELLRHSIEGLSLSAKSFEVSHPVLTGLINTIGRILWNLGI